MASEVKIVKGEIIFESGKINRSIERVVYKSNSTSGKINVPVDLIDKKVYVVWEEE